MLGQDGTVPDPEFDAYLDQVLVGGRQPTEVEIVPYDPSWPQRFEAERGAILDVLGARARRIEHFGSTAVPGLAAKPIVDIMLTVEDPDDESSYAPALERLGYRLRVREPGHRMFRPDTRDVHLHVWPAGGDDEERHILFRDRLRADAGDRAAYEQLKRSLACRWSDMNYYAREKGPFIERVVTEERARRQARATTADDNNR